MKKVNWKQTLKNNLEVWLNSYDSLDTSGQPFLSAMDVVASMYTSLIFCLPMITSCAWDLI